MLLSASFLFNCTKEVGEDDLVKELGIMYEGNSEDPFSGKSVSYYDSGELEIEKLYVDGYRDGLTTAWHKNGEKWFIIEYKNGNAHGHQTSWHANGKKSSQAEFNNDALDGDYKAWYKNGKKKIYAEFEDGEFDGDYTSWYENGNKCIQIDEVTGGELKRGMRSLLSASIFSPDGWNAKNSPSNLRGTKDIIIDGTYKNWYENGELHWKAEFDDGIIDGDIKEWSENGKRLKTP